MGKLYLLLVCCGGTVAKLTVKVSRTVDTYQMQKKKKKFATQPIWLRDAVKK